MSSSPPAARALRAAIIGGLLLALAAGLYAYLREVIEDRLDSGVRTVGTVVDREDLRVRSARESRLTIRYPAGDRTVEVTAMALDFGAPELPKGTDVALSYDRDAPVRMATVNGYASEEVVLVLPRILAMLACCLLVVALVNYLVSTGRD